ncbi:MAG: methyltransferase domain-containing protein [Burkholderiaceae bacterium]
MSPNQISIERYRSKAQGYDASAERTMPLRLRTIALLGLQPGQTVLDVGAGTGLSYAPLLRGVGQTGQVMAFEQSPDMFALAQARVQREGWTNVWHVNQPAESVRLPALADAVLFNYTHDICRSSEAVSNILGQLQPGARVAMAGIKAFPAWTGPLMLLSWLKNRPYNARPGGLRSPWTLVASHCDHFQWQSTQWGMGYIASGIYRGDLR